MLRHAKSSWSDLSLNDFDRPLNARGQKAAPRMGAYMRAEKLTPDLVLCSAARRAVETWALTEASLTKKGGEGVETKYLRSLYLAPPSRILTVLKRLPEEVGCVLMIGHNPGTEHLAAALAGEGSAPKALAHLRSKFPTAGLAELAFETDSWGEVAPGAGKLIRFVTPKSL
ncbi:MAG: histidine phosphatase family protein [Pseudomonadota bacterium]